MALIARERSRAREHAPKRLIRYLVEGGYLQKERSMVVLFGGVSDSFRAGMRRVLD